MGSEWVQMEIERSHPVGGNFIHEEEIQYREALTWEHQADAELEHRLVFQVKQAKRAEFEKLLLDIGNPESERFGMEVTADMIHSMTKNPEGEDIIVDYLRAGGVRITTQEPGFITAAAPVRVWNDILRADFRMVHSGKPHLSVPRTRTYSLPSNVAQHVEMVLNTVQLPLLVDLEEEPAFTAQFSNSTSLSTDEFSATILQTSEMYDGDDAALLEL